VKVELYTIHHNPPKNDDVLLKCRS